MMHYNVHKTFATPHGGGGPGAGPVGVVDELAGVPPLPRESGRRTKGGYEPFEPDNTIGKVHGFTGNWLVLIKTYAYIARLGDEGLADAAAKAVLNANYLAERIDLDVPYGPSTTSSRPPATATPPTSPSACSTSASIRRRRSGRRWCRKRC